MKRTQSGSAMAEFAVLATVMVPMLTMIPVVGNVIGINQTTTQASRYAAWEMTVTNKTTTQLAAEVNSRFFADVQTGQSSLFTPGGDNISVTIEKNGLPKQAGGVLEAGVEALGALENAISGAKWDLENNGLYNVRVAANINASSILGAAKDCAGSENEAVFACNSRSNAILIDSWSAKNAGQVQERVSALVPLGIIRPLGDAIAQLSIIPILAELEGLDGALGEVKPDVLPPDRYGLE